MPARSEVVIVDGYNVLHQLARYEREARQDLDAARARLVADVAAWVGPDSDATVVFDGSANPSSDGAEHYVLNVRVIFSRHGHDADSVIEALASRARSAGRQVTVVTSDAQSQWVALGVGAHRMSSAQFGRELAELAAGHADRSSTGTSKSTLAERIDPSVRDTLARWARGESA